MYTYMSGIVNCFSKPFVIENAFKVILWPISYMHLLTALYSIIVIIIVYNTNNKTWHQDNHGKVGINKCRINNLVKFSGIVFTATLIWQTNFLSNVNAMQMDNIDLASTCM